MNYLFFWSMLITDKVKNVSSIRSSCVFQPFGFELPSICFVFSFVSRYELQNMVFTWAHFIIGQMLNRIHESFESICENSPNTDFMWPKRLWFLNYVFFSIRFTNCFVYFFAFLLHSFIWLQQFKQKKQSQLVIESLNIYLINI